MNAGKNHTKAQAQAQANADRSQSPRWLHQYAGSWWISTTPTADAERINPTVAKGRHHATMKVKIPDSGYVIAPHGGDYVQAFRTGRGALGDSDALKKARRAAEALAGKSRIAVDIVRVGARGQDRYLVEEVYPREWGQEPYRASGGRDHATKKSPAQLDREIAEWQAARTGLSKHHQDLLSRRKPGGGLGAGYLTPAGWHGDPMVIEDRKLRLEALREQPAPRFPKDPGRSHATKKRSHATIGSHPLRSSEEDMLIAMLQDQLEEGEVFRDFFASRGKKRQRWMRALDTRSFNQLDELRRRAAAYGTAAGKELGSSIVDILATRRSQGRSR